MGHLARGQLPQWLPPSHSCSVHGKGEGSGPWFWRAGTIHVGTMAQGDDSCLLPWLGLSMCTCVCLVPAEVRRGSDRLEQAIMWVLENQP